MRIEYCYVSKMPTCYEGLLNEGEKLKLWREKERAREIDIEKKKVNSEYPTEWAHRMK